MKIMLCAISNIASGGCLEDCSFCTQSAFVNTKIQKYASKSVEQVVKEAKIAKANHALGFCLVSSGARLDDKKLEYVCSLAHAINKEDLGLMLIGCNGMASFEQLCELKRAGIFSYNHNLETSQEFYPSICKTHTWEERYLTNEYAKRAGLELCCGGIYGLGESKSDRKSLQNSLAKLKPFSSPVNFFIQNPGLKLKLPKLSPDEALIILDETKKALPNTHIMVAGGREYILGERQYEIFDHGVSAIVIGDYLTAKGEESSKDIRALRELGFEFLDQCH